MNLQGLEAYISELSDPVTLAADDARLPQELRDFLATTPDRRVTLAAPVVELHGPTLTISSASSDVWPVQGLTDVAVTLDHLTVTLADGATPPVAAFATGTMPLGGPVTAPVTVTSQPESHVGAWRIALASDVSGPSPVELLLLGKPGQALPFPVPPGLDALTGEALVPVSGFEVIFYPGTRYEAYCSLALPLALDRPWTIIPSVLRLDAIEMRARVSTRSLSVVLIGRVGVGGVAMDIGIGMQPGAHWLASMKPAEGSAFPGLSAFAAWIGDSSGGSSGDSGVVAAFDSVGFDVSAFDLAIEAAEIGFDWETLALDDLQITSRLTVGGLPLDVVLSLPGIEMRGSLGGDRPLPLIDVLSAWDLPTQGMPSGLKITKAGFSAQPARGFYMTELAVDDVWRAGPIDIAEVDIVLGYSSGAGGLTCDVHGVIEIGTSIELAVQARYDGPPDGWTFRGSTMPGSVLEIGDLVTTLAAGFGVSGVPDAVRSLALSDLEISYRTGPGHCTFTCTGDMTITEVATRLVTAIAVAPALGGGYEATFDGRLDVTVPVDGGTSDLRFEAHFAGDPSAKRFAATYSHSGDDPMPDVESLVAALAPSAAAFVPSGTAVGIRDVVFGLDETPAGTAYLVGIDIDATIDLANLPLVGDHFTASTIMGVTPLRITAASAPIAAAQVTALGALLPDGITRLPERDIAAGFAIDAVLRLSSLIEPLALTVSGAETTPAGTPATASAQIATTAPIPATASIRAAAPITATAPAATTQTGDDVTWLKIHRGFGPVQIKRVGLAYRKGGEAKLAVLLDASITAAGLTLSLDGLEAELSLTNLAARPSFGLGGLGLSYASGPVQIGGAFLAGELAYDGGIYTAYSGGAQIRTEEFGLAALGSYAELPEGPSLFVHAYLDDPIGGPPFFFVRGLAAGFGYNRKLVPPAIDDVITFPLVAEAAGARPSGMTLAGELEALAGYLPPSLGDCFLAAGIHFTSFEMIDSFVLVTASFGHRFELDLLGLSTLTLPAPDAASTGESPIAEVQLALRSAFVPEDGYLYVAAQLTRNSFLLSRDCHLIGGFAFSTWFAGEHDGDFVVTAGGYHPHFPVPAHYPVVPRLGFSWQVSPQLSLTGSAYYALTPCALMAGGSFNVVYHDGGLRAWFDASMDFLIAWQPYHYEASLHVSVGASYTYSAFGKHTIKAHVGTDVHLWGPDFAGTATIHLSVISFEISFGAAKATAPKPVPWTRFRAAMLPDQIITIALKGDIRQPSESPATVGMDLGVVDPAGLVLTTDSLIPCTAGRSGPASAALPADGATTTFGVGPVGVGLGGVSVTHQISVTRKGERADAHFAYEPIRKNLPFALWGAKLTPSAVDPRLISGMLTGYEIRPLPPSEPQDSPWLYRTALQAAGSLAEESGVISLLAPPPFTATGGTALDREKEITRSLASPEVAAARADLAQALLDGAEIALLDFDTSDFHEIPLVASYA